MKSLTVLSTLAVSALAATIPSSNVDYTGYKVVRIPTEEANYAKVLDVIENLKLETWKYPKAAGNNADIVIPPGQIAAFDAAISGLRTEIMHEDLGASISSEAAEVRSLSSGVNATDDWFSAYHSFADHLNWLKDLQKQHASNSEIITVGNSPEGRPIQGIHIWGSQKGKPAVVWHGTTHAREWITTMVVEYMTNSLFTDSAAKAMLEKFDFMIFPVVNPDGFVFTQTGNRLWRKNRTPNPGARCPGTDLNRNWPYQWEGRGSSPDPCSDTYRGRAPGDAPETKLWVSYLQGLVGRQGVKQYVDWHSYGQLFMTPYGYSCSARPPNHNTLVGLASTFGQAARAVHGSAFKTGPICSTIYQANGNSVDWAADVAKIEMAFAAELRDTGRFGFVLPANQIVAAGQETWAGVKGIFSRI
ncbi:hypothetical protein LOZ36_006102 [Ophidiomyces ophidiicola]|nr:hypothetical protein LOZ36_006102 [Ophidiomyces ophidiicola]